MTSRIAVRPLDALLVAAALVLPLHTYAPGCALADDESTPPVEKIDRILVPADRPDLWPNGDWRPLPRNEFEAFLQQRRSSTSTKFEGPIIERAEYAATYVDHSLRDGNLQWRFVHSGNQAQLLPVTPLNLALARDLRTSDGDAVTWGTDDDGETNVFVRSGQTHVQGEWGLGGYRLSIGTEFDIEVPRAQISQFRLTLPEDQVLKASTGIVSGPVPHSRSGWRDWRIDLGGESRLRITISPLEKANEGNPAILATREAHYAIHEGGCAVRTDFSLEVLDGAVDSVNLSIPTNVQIHRITYGDDVPLPWSIVEGNRNHTLTITLPDPLRGRGRAIGIQASSDVTPDAVQSLPQIIMNDTAFAGGRIYLDVRRPLELKSFEPTGCRQIAASLDVPNRETFAFDQFAADARLDVEVGYPRLDLTTAQISLVNVEPQDRSLVSEIEWRATSGSTFEVFCAIRPGWEIVDIQALSKSKLAGWELKQPLAEEHLLVLEFLNALEAGRPKRVRVTARQLSSDATDPLPVPPIEPLGCTSAGMVLGVSRSDATRPVEGPSVLLEPLDLENPPDVLSDSDLWQALIANPQRPTAVYTSDSPNPTGAFTFEETLALDDARAEVVLYVSPSRVREEYRASLAPRPNSPVQRVFVYLTASGENVAWRHETTTSATPLTAKRAPASKAGEWGLPSSGELWELRMPSPQESPFTIVGDRVQDISAHMRPSLLLIPETREFQGVVELQRDAGLDVAVNATGLQPDSPHLAAKDFPPAGPAAAQRWTYRKASDSLELEIDVQTAAAKLRNAAFLELHSILNDDEHGYDVHRATFEVLQPARSRLFRFRLAEPAELLAVELDNRRIIPTARGLDYELPQLPEQASNLIRIDYRTPAGSPHRRRNIIVPRTSWDVLQFDWQFALPPNLSPLALPDSLLLATPLPGITWSERIFGPLGRPVDGWWFNPFSGASWRRLIDAEAARPAAAQQPNLDGFAPRDWTVHRVLAPCLPEHVELALQSQPRATRLGWVGLCGCLVAMLVMRKAGVRLPPILGAGWFCLLLTCALIATAGTALFWGGCLGGSLLGSLWPRRWLSAVKVTSEPRIPEGSTVQLPRSLRATLLLITFALGTHDAGRINLAQTPDEASDTVVAGERAVLVPVRPEGEASQVVYVTPVLLDEIQELQSRPAASAEYLIASATYESRTSDGGPPLVEARFRIVLLSDQKSVRVQLPLTDVHLTGPNSGRVDGQPHPVYRAPGRRGFFVDLERPEQSETGESPHVAEVSFQFFPAEATPGTLFEFGIPAVAASRLILPADDRPSLVSPDLTFAEAGSGTDEHVLRFGRLPRLELKAGGGASVDSSQLTARIFQLAEVRPLGINYNVHAEYKVVRGEVDFVNWRLPPGVVVRKLASKHLIGHSLSALPDGRSLVRIEFAGPAPEDFSVNADLFLAFPDAQDVVTVPSLALVDHDRRRPSNVTVALNQLGVSTTSEFELSPLTPDDESLTSISTDSFARAAEDNPGLNEPQFAYRVLEPADRLFHIDARVPHRRVRATQEAIIDLDTIDWTLNAEIAVESAAAFQHVLSVDSRLRIQSVSVREDGAERLARWWQNGDRVTLFLKDRTAGVQHVVLKGRLPARISVLQTLPVIGFEDAEVTESTLLLYRRRNVQVHVFDSSAAELSQAVPPPASDAKAVGLATLAIRSAAEAPRVRIERLMFSPVAESFTTLQSPDEGTIWRITQRLWLHNLPESAASVRVFIPQALSGQYTIEGWDGEPATETKPDGTRELVIEDRRVPDLVSITVSGSLSEPAGDRWDLPMAGVADFQQSQSYLALSEPSDWRPADDAPLTPGEIPGDIEDLLATAPPAATWTVFGDESSDWTLLRAETAEKSVRSPIAATHTRLWVGFGSDDVDYGCTRIQTGAGFQLELTLTWPQSVTIRAVLVDGIPVAFESAADNRVSVAGGKLSGEAALAVYWSQKREASFPSLGPWRLELPIVQNATVEQAWTSVIPPPQRQLTVSRDLTPVTETEARSDGLAELALDRPGSQRHQLLTRVSPQARSEITGWAHSNMFTNWIFVAAVVSLPFFGLRWLLQNAVPKWLSNHHGLSLCLIAVTWWFFFAWSALGLGLLLIAGLMSAYHVRRRAADERDFIEVPA